MNLDPHIVSRLVPAMKTSSWSALLLAPVFSLAADTNSTASVIATENATKTISNGSPVGNPSAFSTTINIDLKRIYQLLHSSKSKHANHIPEYWDLFVGPVQTATINTTVEPTPIPTSELIPPPSLYYAPFPTGHQSPMTVKNESWKFPSGFFFGVASAAYQIEGAVQAEGRGPSIWDVITHRATYLTTANDTGDVGDNQYYLYKQGKT